MTYYFQRYRLCPGSEEIEDNEDGDMIYIPWPDEATEAFEKWWREPKRWLIYPQAQKEAAKAAWMAALGVRQ